MKREFKYCVLILISVSWLNFTGYSTMVNPDIFSKSYIQHLMEKVLSWQMNNLSEAALLDSVFWENNIPRYEPVPENGWIRGTLYNGVMAAYYATGDEKYLEMAFEWANKNNFKPGPRRRHADDQTVAQVYADLFLIKKDSSMIAPIISNFDLMIEDPKYGPETDWTKSNNWSWCDALYMAPPAMIKIYKITGKLKYLDLMNRMWWDTYDYLYDKEERLFYRDEKFIYQEDGSGFRTKNNKPYFWGRGNGWVIGGLSMVLQYLPKDYKDYSRYIKLYEEMCERFAELQQEDGLWRASINDPEYYPAPETSSTAFITYAMAWGINNGLLNPEKYLPVVKKAWQGLVWAVEENGKLGWVQTVGHRPRKVTKDDTMEYGVGAFLLAANEIIKLPVNANNQN